MIGAVHRSAFAASSSSSSSVARQEFVQRRVEQADGHRQAGHDLEQLDEVLPLHRQDLGRALRDGRPGSSSARIISRTARIRFAVEEHVLRCGIGRCPRHRSSRAVSRVGAAFPRWCAPAAAACPSAHPISVAESRRTVPACTVATSPTMTVAGRAVDGDDRRPLSPYLSSIVIDWCRWHGRSAARTGARPRRAGPCRALRQRRDWSCRRALVRMPLGRMHAVNVFRARFRSAPGSPSRRPWPRASPHRRP